MTAQLLQLHPTTRELGTHVIDYGAKNRPYRFAVVDHAYRALSKHTTLLAAAARCRWHSGTRFVFVEICTGENYVWDGLRAERISWDEGLRRMVEQHNAGDLERVRRGVCYLPRKTGRRG